jgi:hypothetical protein
MRGEARARTPFPRFLGSATVVGFALVVARL